MNKIDVEFSETKEQQKFKINSANGVAFANDIVSNIGIVLRKKTTGFLDFNVMNETVVINDLSKLSLHSRAGLHYEMINLITNLKVDNNFINNNQVAGKASLINHVESLSEKIEDAIALTKLNNVFLQVEDERKKIYEKAIKISTRDTIKR